MFYINQQFTLNFPKISLDLPNDRQSLSMCRQAAWAVARIVRCCTLSGPSVAGLGEPADYTQPIRLSHHLIVIPERLKTVRQPVLQTVTPIKKTS